MSSMDAKISALTLHGASPVVEVVRVQTVTSPQVPPILVPTMGTSITRNDDEIGDGELAEIEKRYIEEQKRSWAKVTRQGPSGQQTFHLIKDPIKFPSEYLQL